MNQTDIQHLSNDAVPRVPSSTRIAIISANWHNDIVHQARDSATQRLVELGVNAANIQAVELPGAFEIPLMAKKLAESGQFDAIIACALIVNGGIYRHEFVADTVIKGLMDVQLKTEVPVFSAVLTPQQFHESAVHHEFFRKHFVIKGIEVAEACASTLHSLERLRGQVAAGIVG